jgi:hypothetical protein
MVWRIINFSDCFKSQLWDGILIYVHHREFMPELFWRLDWKVTAFQGCQPSSKHVIRYRAMEFSLLYAWLYFMTLQRKFTVKQLKKYSAGKLNVSPLFICINKRIVYVS